MLKHITKHFYAITVNDNRLPGKGRKGSIMKAGRCYLHYRSDRTDRARHIDLGGVEWNFGKLNFGWGITLHGPGDERDLSGKLQLPGASFYWGLNTVPRWRWVQKRFGLYKEKSTQHPYGQYINRQIGVEVFDWKVWVALWKKPFEWSSRDPKWWQFNVNINPMDILFGRTEYTEGAHLVYDDEVDFPMPERSYRGRVKIQVDEWKRPRLPWFPKTLTRAHVDLDEDPIPFPGKGTCSYNCGDDAIHGSTFPCDNVEEAIGHVVGTVLRSRKRYGGSHAFTPTRT